MRARSASATAIIAALLVLACQSTVAPTASPDGGAPPTSPAASGAPTTEPAPTEAPPAELPPTSEKLIGAALEAGTITYEESLLYRALALLNSPGLPDAYRSPVADLDAATELLSEVDAHEAELSGAVLAQLAPYRVRPADPTSVFNTVATTPVAALAGHSLTASAPVWKHEPAAAGAARVWVPESPGYERRLTQHAEDVTRVWAAMQDVFTYPDPDTKDLPSAAVNPDAAVDFYWIELSDLDPRRAECAANPAIEHCVLSSYNAQGFARAAEPRRAFASSAYFVLDAARTSDEGLFLVAHELAHGSQFHYDSADSTWLHEATANWVAYRVFQKLDLPPEPAYEWAKKLFRRLDMPITSEIFRGYDAWLYFQFAAMEEGDGVVTRIWESAAKSGVNGEEAVDAVFPFDKQFANFALRNWNEEPVPRRYRNAPDPTFPSLKPRMEVNEQMLTAGAKTSLEAALPRLASAYYSYTIDPAVRKVTFDNKLMGVAGAHVWAIVSIGGTGSGSDFVEDWGGVSKRVFCLPRENVRKVVLVVSNSQVAPGSTLSGKIDIDPLATGCGAGGLVTYNRTIVKSVATPSACGGGSTLNQTQTVTVSVAFDANSKGTATLNDQQNRVEVSTFIDCSTGKTSTVTATYSAHIVGTKDAIAFWLINSEVLEFRAFWEMVTGGTSLFEMRCEPVSCDENIVEEKASFVGTVVFQADVDPDAAVISGSKVEDASEEGVSDITTYTWTIEQ